MCFGQLPIGSSATSSMQLQMAFFSEDIVYPSWFVERHAGDPIGTSVMQALNSLLQREPGNRKFVSTS